MSLLLLFLSASAALPYALGQSQCDGTPIPEAAGMAAYYPPGGQKAEILDGDDEARSLFETIMAADAPPLEFAPSTMDDKGFFNVSYDYNSDDHCWWSATTCHEPKYDHLPEDFYHCPTPETWGLSLDDGPTCAHTPLYDQLKEDNQLASLYYIGINVLSHPAEGQRGFTDGHEICVHTWSHPYMTTLTNEEVFAELYYTKKVIKEVTGYSSRCWRPPYGDVDDRVRTIAQALDLRTHLWNHDTDDWRITSVGEAEIQDNYAEIVDGDHSESGIVVLAHEVNPQTVKVFLDEWGNIKQHFKHITPVSTCMNNTGGSNFAEEHSPSLPDFEAYVNGWRGDDRGNSLFYNTSDVVFTGNGIIANAESASSQASSTSMMTSSSSAPSSVFSATFNNPQSANASLPIASSSIEEEEGDESSASLVLPLTGAASSVALLFWILL